MNGTMHAITAERLTKIYGAGNAQVVAMENVSFNLDAGEVVALLGPSGAGKSTLLTIVGLINTPTSGKLTIGSDLVADGPTPKVDLRAFRRQFIGYVLQKANLIPFLTAIENVQLALEINDVPRKPAKTRALELLEYLGVKHRIDNLPHMLSGGEQQRVAVARALANKPYLVETSGLQGTQIRPFRQTPAIADNADFFHADRFCFGDKIRQVRMDGRLPA